MAMGQRFDSVITWIENAVMLVSYLTIILVVGLETIRRIITGEQAAWGPEVAMGAFVWMSWFAMASGIKSRTHLSFTMFRQRMSYRTRQVFEIIDCLLWLALGVIVMVVSWEVVVMNGRFNQKIFGTDIPLSYISIAVPIGWAFTMVRVIQQFFEVLKGNFGEGPAAEDIR